MKCFYAFLLTFLVVTGGYSQSAFRVDGTLKNKSNGKPETGIKIEIIQGTTLASTTTTSNGRYDLKSDVDLKKPFTVKFSKAGFAPKIVAYDFSKMNPEDAPAGEFKPAKGDGEMIPIDAGIDLSFLSSEPVAKFYWDEKNLVPTYDAGYGDKMRVKIENILAAASANNGADDAKYNALIAEADNLYGLSKWEEARTKYEASLQYKPMEKHPNDRIVELDALILAKQKEAIANGNADTEYTNLITAADALRDQKKYEQAILKYEEALRKKQEDYPETQIEVLTKLVESDKKYKEAITQADMFFTQKSFLAAKDKYTIANKLKPEEPHPIARLAAIAAKENELNAASEKKKKYEDALAAGDAAFDAAKWVDAKAAYQLALTIETGSSYADERSKLCDIKIAEQAAEIAKQEKIAKFLEEGNTLFVGSKWNDSKAKYDEVIKLDSENATALARLDEIALKIKEAGDLAAQKVKFDKLVLEGDAFAKTTKWNDAKLKYEEAIAMQADPAVQTKLDNVNKELQKLADKDALDKQFQELKAAGLLLASEEKWLDAKDKLTQANGIKIDAQVTAKLAEIETKIKANESLLKLEQEYAALIEKATQKELAKEYDAAIASYKEAGMKKPTEELPKIKIPELEALKKANALQSELDKKYNEFLSKGKALMANSQYLAAITEFNNALALKSEEKEPADLAAEAERLEREKGNEEDSKIEKIFSVAQSKFDEKDYTKSKELVERYLTFKKDEPKAIDLLKKITDLEKAKRDYDLKMIEAEKLSAEKKYELAINAFEQAKLIKTDETKPQERINEIIALQTALASSAEKEAIYADFMQKGGLSEKAETWDQALVNYQSALNTKPGDKPAQAKVTAMQAKIDELANKMRSEQERIDNFKKLIQEADNLFASEDYLSAKLKYEAALVIISDDVYAIKQAAECQLREGLRSENQFKKGYQKIIEKADENFDVKDYDKAIEYYKRAEGMNPTDPYPPKRLKEIDAILNPPAVVSVNLQPLGIPYEENSIVDGQALLLQAEAERKNFKDQKVEDLVTNANATTNELGEIADEKQVKNTNEIFKVTSQVMADVKEGDERRQAIVEALRVADNENELIDRAAQEYKNADLLRQQDRLDIVEGTNQLDYSVRDEVYGANNNVLHAYEGALQAEHIAANEGENNTSLQTDQSLKKVVGELSETDYQKVERQMKNEGIVLEVAAYSAESYSAIANAKSEALLDNENQIEQVTIGYSEKAILDSKHAPENKEKITVVSTIFTDAEKIRDEAFSQRTSDNNQNLGGITISLSEDETNRDENRQENVELVKGNESNIIIGKQEKFESENLKYLKNKNSIETEAINQKGVVVQGENQVAGNITGIENKTILAKDNLATRSMSDDAQRQDTRSGIEIRTANAEEFSGSSTDKQHASNEKVKDLNTSIQVDQVNKEQHKQEELLAARAKIDQIEAKKPEKASIKNSLGEEFPEGVSQESFTQNDENGIMKAIITRRIVVRNGEGSVYVRTQTLHATTYSRNDKPITEQHWNSETAGANLIKNY
ncbi:MAG: hypothetical protein V4638_04400 [Bacteroidota bacterium]